MFHFVVEWVELEENVREPNLSQLLESIPLTSLNLKFLREIVGEKTILRQNMKCLKLFVEALIEFSYYNDLIYVFGGTNISELSSVSKFDSSTGIWSESTMMLGKRSHFDCAVVRDKIYLCGGFDGEKYLNTLEVFDTKTETFQSLTPMKHARNGCGVAALNGFLYAAGGWNGENCLGVVEKYSIETNQWQEVSPMQTKRSGLKLVELNGELYALGGEDEEEDSLNTIECYDPKEDRWRFKASMKNENAWFSAVSFQNKIYIVGDNSSEVYNPEKDRWKKMPTSNANIDGQSLVAFKCKLVLIGGRIGDLGKWKGIRTVQYYDFVNRVWKTLKEMNVARCYHSTAVISSSHPDSFDL